MTFWNEKKETDMTNKENTSKADKQTIVSELSSDLVKRWGTVQSALSAGSKVEGKLAFDRPVRIDGELSGEVKAKDALILIGPEGKVNASLDVAYLVVMGELNGTVTATEKIDLIAGGSLTGDIETPKFTIQDGGEFNGSCKMQQVDAKKEQRVISAAKNGTTGSGVHKPVVGSASTAKTTQPSA